MNHKKYMEHLKENDPITYYELNSDPTNGADTSYVDVLGIISLVLITLTLYFIS